MGDKATKRDAHLERLLLDEQAIELQCKIDEAQNLILQLNYDLSNNRRRAKLLIDMVRRGILN